jgi:hypothetical protein
MLTVNIFDSEFDHSLQEDGFYTASMGVKPTLIEYVKNQPVWDGITLFTERHLHQAPLVDSKIKVAWLIESPGVHPWAVDVLNQYEGYYDLILTSQEDLLKRGPKYKKVTVGSCRIKPENRSPIQNKTKNCSLIASNKKQLEGHRLRHEVVSTLSGFDVWGSGYKYFDEKEEALQDYRFSICIMNVSTKNYFTEILTDCFFVGTIPIFWGCPNLGDYFNPEGIITFETVEELRDILPTLTKELYDSKLDAVKDNYDKVQKYKSTDDLVASILLKEALFIKENI